MYNSGSLEYIVGSSYMADYRPGIAYFSRSSVDKYEFARTPMPELFYIPHPGSNLSGAYTKSDEYPHHYFISHSLSPSIFLSPSRPIARFVDDSGEARKIAEEVFEAMANEKLPKEILISVLPLSDFRIVHSQFGSWDPGILGFSVNGRQKLVFVKEDSLDSMLIVLGHEIGHVLTDPLPNKHDEEAKAFAFSIEWAKAIKRHDIAGLGKSISDELNFNPARNGLHDVAFGFVDFMMKKGRKAFDVHKDLTKGYRSVFDANY